jgi:hypothetical protein
MENNNNTTDIKSIGVYLGISYILLGIALFLQIFPATGQFSLLVGIIGIIIFLTQRKYIKDDIKLYVYISIVIYIISFLLITVYVFSLAFSFKGYTSKGFNGTALYGFIIDIVIGTFIVYIFYLITYIMTSIRFLIGKMKYLVSGFQAIGTAFGIIYIFLTIASIKSKLVSKDITISYLTKFTDQLNYLFLSSPFVIFRILQVALISGSFILLGFYINKHINSYVKTEEEKEKFESQV